MLPKAACKNNIIPDPVLPNALLTLDNSAEADWISSLNSKLNPLVAANIL